MDEQTIDEMYGATPDCAERGPHLAALLDGELDERDRETLTAHLRQCPTCASALERQRDTKAALAAVATELRAPAWLLTRLEASLGEADRRDRFRPRLEWLSGIAAVFLVLAVAGWLVQQRSASTEPALVLATRAHQAETLGSASVSYSSGDASAVARWAATIAGRAVDVPSFAESNYRLLGARTDASVARGAISLIYEGPGGPMTCVVVGRELPLGGTVISPGSSPAVHLLRTQGVTAVGWWQDGTTYIIVANQPQPVVIDLANEAVPQY